MNCKNASQDLTQKLSSRTKAFLSLLWYETQQKHAPRANPNHLDTTAMYRLRENSFCWTKYPRKKITEKKCDWVFAQRRMSGRAEFHVLSLRKWRRRQNRNQKCGSRRRTKTTKTELTELRSYGGGFLCLYSHWVFLFPFTPFSCRRGKTGLSIDTVGRYGKGYTRYMAR